MHKLNVIHTRNDNNMHVVNLSFLESSNIYPVAMEPKSKKRTPDGAAENYSTRSDTMSNSPVSSTDFGSLPLPPDGGYGWVVVGVTFIGFGILDGMPGVTGVLMPHLLEEFNQGRAKTALASSLFVGMYLMLGTL